MRNHKTFRSACVQTPDVILRGLQNPPVNTEDTDEGWWLPACRQVSPVMLSHNWKQVPSVWPVSNRSEAAATASPRWVRKEHRTAWYPTSCCRATQAGETTGSANGKPGRPVHWNTGSADDDELMGNCWSWQAGWQRATRSGDAFCSYVAMPQTANSPLKANYKRTQSV